MHFNTLHVGDLVLDKRSLIMSWEQQLHHNLADSIMSFKENKKGVGEMSPGFPRYRGKLRYPRKC